MVRRSGQVLRAASRGEDTLKIHIQVLDSDTNSVIYQDSLMVSDQCPITDILTLKSALCGSVVCQPVTNRALPPDRCGRDGTYLAVPNTSSPQEEPDDCDRIEAKIRSKIVMDSASPADWIWETLAVLEAEGKLELVSPQANERPLTREELLDECDKLQKLVNKLMDEVAAPKVVDSKEEQEAKDRLEVAELLGTAYGVLHRIANDYYVGDTISTGDIDKARDVVIAIDVATESREKRKLNGTKSL